jgi:hypothetical protein
MSKIANLLICRTSDHIGGTLIPAGLDCFEFDNPDFQKAFGIFPRSSKVLQHYNTFYSSHVMKL